MSLMIDMNQITDVLLADGWVKCRLGSFTVDSFEFVYDIKEPLHKDGKETSLEYSGGAGAMWESGETGRYVACPIQNILAVRCTRRKRVAQ